MSPAEHFFTFMLQRFLGVRDRRLCADIWRAYPKSQTLIYQLGLCTTPPRNDLEGVARIKRMSELLDPHTLLRTVEKLVIPTKVRPPEIQELEERILYATTREGTWRW
jgi:hypothetical protein